MMKQQTSLCGDLRPPSAASRNANIYRNRSFSSGRRLHPTDAASASVIDPRNCSSTSHDTMRSAHTRTHHAHLHQVSMTPLCLYTPRLCLGSRAHTLARKHTRTHTYAHACKHTYRRSPLPRAHTCRESVFCATSPGLRPAFRFGCCQLSRGSLMVITADLRAG